MLEKLLINSVLFSDVSVQLTLEGGRMRLTQPKLPNPPIMLSR